MKFSIIIPMKKISEYFKGALPYFEKQTFKSFEILILTDNQEDYSFKKSKIISTGKVSPAIKRNRGVKKAKGEIIVFIDDDAFPEEAWLEKAAKEFENENVIAIGGPSLPTKNSSFFQKVSNKVYELSSKKTGMRYGKGKEKRQKIDDWPTCNFFVRKKEFEKTKGFDERYWGGEDTQLCYDLLKTGGKMFFNPEIFIYHHPRKSLANHLKQSFFWGMWRGFFMRKHKESRQLTFFIPAIFVLWLFFGGFLTFFNEIFGWIYLLSVGFYLLFLIIKGLQTKSIRLFFPVMFVMFFTQVIYGLGFLKGIFSRKHGPTKKGMHPEEKLKINN